MIWPFNIPSKRRKVAQILKDNQELKEIVKLLEERAKLREQIYATKIEQLLNNTIPEPPAIKHLEKIKTVMVNDQRLAALAEYVVTHGRLTKASPDIHNRIVNEFARLKTLIKRKKTTLHKLEDTLYSQYGIIETSDAAVMPTYDPVEFDSADIPEDHPDNT